MSDIKPLNLDGNTAKTQPVPMNTMGVGIDKSKAKKKMFGLVGGLVILGILSGYGAFQLNQPKGPKKLASSIEEGAEKGSTFGVQDEKAFSDEVEGEMVAGGVDGEGSHHLEREGGISQNVYLTSSIIDLDQFVGKKVRVWGQTFEAQTAGWLMDVGRLEIL